MASNWPSCTNPCKNTRNDSWSCCSLIGHKKTKVLWHQSEARTTATVWNWSGKTVSPGALRFVLYFSSPKYFSPLYDFPLAPTNCPWVSEDGHDLAVVQSSFIREEIFKNSGQYFYFCLELFFLCPNCFAVNQGKTKVLFILNKSKRFINIVYSKRCIKFYLRFVVAPTCVRKEPNKVHSSILISEPVTGKNLEGLTSKYREVFKSKILSLTMSD